MNPWKSAGFWGALGCTAWLLAIIVIFFYAQCAHAETRFFTERPLFEDPIAYKRSPESGISVKRSRYLGSDIVYFESVIGKSLPIVTKEFGELKAQFGTVFATWMTLGYKEGAFPLLTQDFLLSAPISFRYKDFSWSVRYNHISAHLGDGMDRLLEDNMSAEDKEKFETHERIADSMGVDIKLMEPFAYSREFITGHFSYDYKMGLWDARTYLQVGYIWRVIPRGLGQYFIGGGVEAVYPSILSPYYAVDVTYNDDVSLMDVSGQVGVFLLSGDEKGVTIRLALTGHNGSDRRGQMLGRTLRQLGLGLFIR
jgi:hypothetical protein